MNYIIILFITFLSIQKSLAFSLNTSIASAFHKNEVTVNVANHACDNAGVTPSEILSMVNEATANFWNTVPTSRLKLKVGGLVSVSSAFRTDALCSTNNGSCQVNPDLVITDQILISCNSDSSTKNFSSNTSILALAVPNNIKDGDIHGAVIILNDITGTQLASYNRSEFIAVLAHEIGHAIGLGHSPVTDSLMYYKNHPNRKYLGLDDMDGVSYLYPRRQPISCGTIEYINSNTNKKDPVLSLLLLALVMIGVSFAIKKRNFNS